MRTWSRISTALAVSAAESACACWRSTSSIWRPTLRIGLSAARGFWKIIDISRPRRSRIWSSSAARTSTPENITEPSAMRPARSRMRITANEVTDLPEPDSPTIPSVSPLATSILMCCTALTMPRRVENSTVRSLMSSSGTGGGALLRSGSLRSMRASRAPLRIDDVAQAVAQQIEAEHRDHQREPGKERDPPFARHHEGRAFGDHDAPLGIRRAHAESDEGQARRIEDRVAHRERHLPDHDRNDVGQDLRQQDARLAVAGEPRRLHEARLAPHVRFRPGNARIKWEVHDRGRDDDVLHRVAERRHDAHREYEQRERHDGVGDAADDAVGPAAVEAGRDPGEPAHQETEHEGEHGDDEAEPRRHDQ